MSGTARSRASRLGASVQSPSRQPRPRSQPPSGTRARASTTRSSASSSERTPSSRACRSPSDQVGKCTCESVKPGKTQRSPSSITPSPALSSSTTHGPRTASCPTTGAAGSSVLIVPPVNSTGGRLRARACRGARVHERLHRRLDLRAQLLEPRRDRQLLAERLERLVDREARARGGQLEQHAARLTEVDRLEVVAVDHLGRVRAVLGHPLLPLLVVLVGRVPGDVVNRPAALDAALGGRLVIEVEA